MYFHTNSAREAFAPQRNKKEEKKKTRAETLTQNENIQHSKNLHLFSTFIFMISNNENNVNTNNK